MLAAAGAGLVAGVALGAAIALLTAPHAGEYTRLLLGRELRRHRPWRTSPWDRLGEELHKVVQRRNGPSRSAQRSRRV